MADDFEIIEERLGVTVRRFDELTSTNDLCKAPDLRELSVVIAEVQSAGRGQRGNSWSSRKGENLTFSVLLKPDFLAADMQFYISKIAALSVCKALETCGVECKIKWPNDIYIGDKKVCGILIENDIMGAKMSKSVVGVGINVNQTVFNPELPNPTSIITEINKQTDRVVLLEGVCGALIDFYEALYTADFEFVDELYSKKMYRYDGQRYRFFERASGKEFMGIIVDVRRSGEINIRHENGMIKRYAFGEIAYII